MVGSYIALLLESLLYILQKIIFTILSSLKLNIFDPIAIQIVFLSEQKNSIRFYCV